jgi:hypothetical protein
MDTMLFRVCQIGSPARWSVLVGDQPYGDYLDEGQAVIDATEAAAEARQAGRSAEVWDGAVRVY